MSSKKEKIIALLKQGKCYREIAEEVRCSKATISYHASRLEGYRPKGHGVKFDWALVEQFYEDGHSPKECKEKFGISNGAWGAALKSGKIKSRHRKPLTSELLVEGSRFSRTHLKKRLLNEGWLKNQCYICGQLPEWQGKPMALVLDHINGVYDDNRLENLRIVCRHCDCQLPTFTSKNRKYK
jgi:hypothetical protein